MGQFMQSRKAFPVGRKRPVDNNDRNLAGPARHAVETGWSIQFIYLYLVFFKQFKQTLQLADFLGNSANAAFTSSDEYAISCSLPS